MKFRSKIRNREALALDTRADVLDMLMADAVCENEEIDGAIVVRVTGPLEHHAVGYGDSYEQIRARFAAALEAKPGCIVLRIDSPGGVVSGLNQMVYDLTAAKESAGIPVYAYADELIASAAYALSCVADEIVCPPSGIVGSIGVISLMADQVSADKKAGLNFVTITSGERKADGHPHTPISDEAIAAEELRVDALAQQFFAIVKAARGFDPEPLQAGIFTGADAVAKGVADEVMGWEELLAQIRLAHGGTGVSASPAVAQPGTVSQGAHGESQMLKIQALIAARKAALKLAKTAAKRASLRAEIATYQITLAALGAEKRTKYKLEEEETVEDDEPDKDDEEESSEEEESEEESAESDEPKKDDEEESEEEESEEDDEPKKDARKGKAAAIADKARAHDALQAKVARLEAQERDRRKAAAIAASLAAHFISPAQAKMLAGKKAAFVAEYLPLHKTRLFLTDGEESAPREGTGFATTGNFSDEQMAQFRAAALASDGRITVDQMIENYRKNPNATNGVAGAR